MGVTVPAFVARAARGGPPVGRWLMSAAPSTAEALRHQGFDFLVLDMEHVPIGIAEAERRSSVRDGEEQGGEAPLLPMPGGRPPSS